MARSTSNRILEWDLARKIRVTLQNHILSIRFNHRLGPQLLSRSGVKSVAVSAVSTMLTILWGHAPWLARRL